MQCVRSIAAIKYKGYHNISTFQRFYVSQNACSLRFTVGGLEKKNKGLCFINIPSKLLSTLFTTTID